MGVLQAPLLATQIKNLLLILSLVYWFSANSLRLPQINRRLYSFNEEKCVTRRFSSPGKSLPAASPEQIEIVKCITTRPDVNLIVDSVAGSGKTTTILHLAAEDPKKTILLLTYNARLKDETRDRVAALGLQNTLEVHSYHAMGMKYYNKQSMDDTGIRKAVESDSRPMSPLPNYDIIVVDEAQDMIPLYHQFLSKILKDVHDQWGTSPQIMLTGDEYQELYGFKEADSRYLTLAGDGVFAGMSVGQDREERAWMRRNLRTSYRVTGNIATFINKAMFGGFEQITAWKPAGDPVDYYVGNPYDAAEDIAEYLLKSLKKGLYTPEDIFILAPSVKASEKKDGKEMRMRPIQHFENILSKENIPIYMPMNEEQNLKADLIKKKVVISTLHQAKGLERKCVVIFDFANSYFQFYAKSFDPKRCPPTLYVGVTRALEKLILVAEQEEGAHLPFLDRKCIRELTAGSRPVVRVLPPEGFITTKKFKSAEPYIPKRKVSVVELVKYLPDHVSARVSQLLDKYWVKVQKSSRKLEVPSAVESDRGTESVADINGLAIPAMLEMKLTKGKLTLYDMLAASVEDSTDLTLDPKITRRFKKLGQGSPRSKPSYYLQLATLYEAGASSERKAYISRLLQIENYNWLTEDVAEKSIQRLENVLFEGKGAPNTQTKGLIFEESLKANHSNYIISGRVDIVTPHSLVEVKCVKTLTFEHKLQLAVYVWLCQMNAKDWSQVRKYQLYNVYTDELLELDISDKEAKVALNTTINALMRQYVNRDVKRVNDDQFLRNAAANTEKFRIIKGDNRAKTDRAGTDSDDDDDDEAEEDTGSNNSGAVEDSNRNAVSIEVTTVDKPTRKRPNASSSKSAPDDKTTTQTGSTPKAKSPRGRKKSPPVTTPVTLPLETVSPRDITSADAKQTAGKSVLPSGEEPLSPLTFKEAMADLDSVMQEAKELLSSTRVERKKRVSVKTVTKSANLSSEKESAAGLPSAKGKSEGTSGEIKPKVRAPRKSPSKGQLKE